ncbi:hypothetical protein D3C83_216410 [compost metagenome]
MAAILLAALALGLGAIALVLAVPAEHRVALTAGLALAFLAAAALIAWKVNREAKARPFAASVAELRRDAGALGPRE